MQPVLSRPLAQKGSLSPLQLLCSFDVFEFRFCAGLTEVNESRFYEFQNVTLLYQVTYTHIYLCVPCLSGKSTEVKNVLTHSWALNYCNVLK